MTNPPLLARWRRRRRAARAARAVLPAVLSRLDARPAGGREAPLRISETGVVTTRAVAGGETLVVKIATAPGGAARLHDEVANLEQLGSLPAFGEIVPLLPGVVAAGDADGAAYVAQRVLPGTDGERLLRLPETRWPLLAAARDVAAALHAAAAPTTVDGAVLEEWVERPAAIVRDALAPGRPTLPERLERATDELRSALERRAVVAGWIHGDFWPGNLLASSDGARVTGIVDWDRASPRHLPALDLVHLTLYTGALLEGRPLGTLVADAVAAPARFAELVACPELEEPALARAAVLLYWLTHVAQNLEQSEHYLGDRRWLAANVDAVLAAATGGA